MSGAGSESLVNEDIIKEPVEMAADLCQRGPTAFFPRVVPCGHVDVNHW